MTSISDQTLLSRINFAIFGASRQDEAMLNSEEMGGTLFYQSLETKFQNKSGITLVSDLFDFSGLLDVVSDPEMQRKFRACSDEDLTDLLDAHAAQIFKPVFDEINQDLDTLNIDARFRLVMDGDEDYQLAPPFILLECTSQEALATTVKFIEANKLAFQAQFVRFLLLGPIHNILPLPHEYSDMDRNLLSLQSLKDNCPDLDISELKEIIESNIDKALLHPDAAKAVTYQDAIRKNHNSGIEAISYIAYSMEEGGPDAYIAERTHDLMIATWPILNAVFQQLEPERPVSAPKPGQEPKII